MSSGFASLTLKASHNIAQGKRSGIAAKRHPGYRAENLVPTRNGLHKSLWNPFRVRLVYVTPQPRAALRLPWAMICNRFAVRAVKRAWTCVEQRGQRPRFAIFRNRLGKRDSEARENGR